MSKSKVNQYAVGVRLGRLLSALEAARSALQLADCSTDLLTETDRNALRKAASILGGIEQRAWELVSKTRLA